MLSAFFSRISIHSTRLRHLFTRRSRLILAGAVVCIYSLSVLHFVQSMPDLGLKTIFNTQIKGAPRFYKADGPSLPQEGDTVEKVGDETIHTWPDLLNAPYRLREKLSAGQETGDWFK